MGLEYYILDHGKKAIFELSKGSWGDVLNVRGNIHHLAKFCHNTIFSWGEYTPEEELENRFYCYWVAEQLREFVTAENYDDLEVVNDASTEVYGDYIGIPAMKDKNPGKGYKITHSRFSNAWRKELPRLKKYGINWGKCPTCGAKIDENQSG